MRPVYTWNDVSRTSKRENNSALRCWLGLPILVACDVGLPWAANCDADRLGGYGRHGDGVSNCFCQFINVLSVSLKIISTGRMHTESYFHVFYTRNTKIYHPIKVITSIMHTITLSIFYAMSAHTACAPVHNQTQLTRLLSLHHITSHK